MFHACVQRFDVTGNLKILAKFSGTKLDPTPWKLESGFSFRAATLLKMGNHMVST